MHVSGFRLMCERID